MCNIVAMGFLVCCLAIGMLAQEGMTRQEFYRKLESYFDRELISDLDAVFGADEKLAFYSWDAGDFSGDGNYDLVCVVRNRLDKERRLQVYLFVDSDGFLRNLTVKEYRFIELPLEVGVVIRYGVCYITEKLQQFNWRISGYRFDGIALLLVTQYYTRRIYSYTLQQTLNYAQLLCQERWSLTSSGTPVLESKRAILPLYPRAMQVSRGYRRRVELGTVDFVQRGSFYWSGATDCSMALWGMYDTNAVYMTIAVRDDHVVTGYCDTCVADRIELWWDVFSSDSTLPSRALMRTKRGVALRLRSDAPQIGFEIRLGNFADKLPSAKLLVTDSSMLTRLRIQAFADVALHVEAGTDGYTVRIRVPWLLLHSELSPPYNRERSLGMVALVHDVDNEFRPEEETLLASSTFQQHVPATMSEVRLLPQGQFLGQVDYVYADRIVEQLRQRGF